MPEITPYRSRVLPTGRANTNANAYDFGAQVGQGLGQAGASMAQAGEAISARGASHARNAENAAMLSNIMYGMEVRDEVTSVHTQVADIHARAQQHIQELYNNTQPGDKQFISKVSDYIDREFKNIQPGFTTQQSNNLLSTQAADLKRQFIGQAIDMQANLEGRYASTQYSGLVDNYSRIASNNENEFGRSIEQVNKAIDDPEGRFARIPAAAREQYKYEAKQKIMTATAMGFVRRNPGAVMDKLSPELVDHLKTSYENPPAAGLPPNLNASTVKPYDADAVAYRARRLSVPTKYDEWFEQAARKEGIDPRELKLRSLVESNFDPNAKSKQGAGGIMQFTEDTAKGYGIDRNDPRDAIFGAARMLADYQRKAGGDMSKVDMMYYGGESGTGWGPNTRQYAANLAAVRQAVGLATTRTPESFAPSAAQLTGDKSGWQPIKTGFDFIDNLPVDAQYSVLDKAHVMNNAKMADIERARVERERSIKIDQEANMTSIMKRIYDPQNNGGTITAQDIQNNSKLDPEQSIRMQNVLTHFNNEQSATNKNHPDKYVEFIKGIYAPDNSPDKIYNDDAIYNAMSKGELSASEFIDLRDKLMGHKNDAGSNINTYTRDALSSAERALYQSPRLRTAEAINPGAVREVAARFHQYMEAKISEYRKAKKDPADLFFDEKNPDNLYNPKLLQRFIPHTSLADAAATKVATETASATVVKSDAEYNDLPAGALFRGPDDKLRRKPSESDLKIGDQRNGWTYVGGDPANKSSWKK